MKTRKKPSPEILTLDSLCRQYVFMRDRFLCVKCLHLTKRRNGDRLQFCHVYTRAIHSLRWDPENSMVLCSGHHLWWHREPAAAIKWWSELYPERERRLELLRQTPRKIDRVAIRMWLESQIAKLEGK
jgi:5-methylcytosine-specific restriction endonuclease McrA